MVDEKKILAAGINTNPLLGAGIMAGGSLLSSWMESEYAERQAKRQLELQREMFKHQKNMQESQNKMAGESHGVDMDTKKFQLNTAIRDDANQQAMYLNALRTMNAGK